MAKKKKAAKKAKKGGKKKAKAVKKSAKKKTKRKPNAAFMAPLQPSSALAEVVGSKPLPRTMAVKKLWAYIKSKKLQDSKNKRQINTDDKLRPIFGGNRNIDMFQMMKHLKKHLS